MTDRPVARTQEQRSAETRERLLKATIESLVELGYAGASTTDICARAGLSRGAQLHHFPTKAALMAEAISYLFARRHAEVREVLAAGGDLGEAVAALWRIYSGPTFYAWLELVVAARTDAALREQLRAVDDQFFDEARATCRRLLSLPPEVPENDVAVMTRVVLSIFDGVAINHTLGGRDELTRAVLARLPAALGALAAAGAVPAAPPSV